MAGLTCSEVMAALSDLADGDVADAVRLRIEAHVAGCDWCARFGADFTALLAAMRRQMAAADEVPADVVDRVRAALHG